MYGYTMSTPLDRTYRFDPKLTITLRDHGASVWLWRAGRKPRFVGTILLDGTLRRPGR